MNKKFETVVEGIPSVAIEVVLACLQATYPNYKTGKDEVKEHETEFFVVQFGDYGSIKHTGRLNGPLVREMQATAKGVLWQMGLSA